MSLALVFGSMPPTWGPTDSIADEHANSSTEMDVPPVYTRMDPSCTRVVEEDFSTGSTRVGGWWADSCDGVDVSISRRLPPPVWVAVAVALSLFAIPRADATVSWSWPLVGPIVRAFDKPENDYSEGHRGIDIGAIRGREVRSPVDGVVWFAGVVAGRSVLSIDTADGFIVSMEPVEASVTRGDVVRAREPVGLISEQHDGMNALHLGVRVNGVYVDPLRYLGNPPRIVVYDSWVDSYALG